MEKSINGNPEKGMKKIIIFGAGNFGKLALEYYGCENVKCFVDNNIEKAGKEYCGKKIIAFRSFLSIAKNYRIVIAVNFYEPIAKQLIGHNIEEFMIFSPGFIQALENVRAIYPKIKSNVILFGIDGFTRFLLEDMYQYELKSGQIILAEVENHTLIGKKFEGYRIYQIENIMNLTDIIVISSKDRASALQVYIENLENEAQIINPFIQKKYYNTPELIFNPYSTGNINLKEDDWNNSFRESTIHGVSEYARELGRHHPLFELVEIETINRCNGKCDFCPVSVNHDIREKSIMEETLFKSIIDQLAKLEYSGRLATFSNNEPFLDKRIIQFNKYARENLPKARMHLFTNGTLLSLDKFIEIIKYLDELIIDNYDQDLELIPNCVSIKKYCEKYPYLKEKVTIVLRKPHEILTSRGGDAPNRKNITSYPDASCALPFKQLIIRPDGKVSLCCNDPYGRCTLGDLTKQTIMEVWEGKDFNEIRRKLLDGRKNVKHCIHCDTFIL